MTVNYASSRTEVGRADSTLSCPLREDPHLYAVLSADLSTDPGRNGDQAELGRT